LYSDKVMTCADCSQDFVFTAREQEFYATRGFTSRAVARPAAQAARRLVATAAAATAAVRLREPQQWRLRRQRRRLRWRQRRRILRGPARCSRQPAPIAARRPGPFRPTSGKPVYCSDCFALRRLSAGAETRSTTRPPACGGLVDSGPGGDADPADRDGAPGCPHPRGFRRRLVRQLSCPGRSRPPGRDDDQGDADHRQNGWPLIALPPSRFSPG